MDSKVAELFPNGVKSLERLSKEWTDETPTKERLVHISGSGNMFGGNGKLIHIIVHGNRSITKTGTIEIAGEVSYVYNIGRGANGPTSSTATYYPVDRKTGEVNEKFEKQAHIHGSAGADDALAAVLNLEKDWILK